jgi:hypothetical protein
MLTTLDSYFRRLRTTIHDMTSNFQYFYLKSTSPSSESSPVSGEPGRVRQWSNRYVRYTSGGFHDIVLTEEHPKFIRFYFEHDSTASAPNQPITERGKAKGRILASYGERVFGVVMQTDTDEQNEVVKGLRKVEMYENFEAAASTGFYFDDEDGGKLKWENADGSGSGFVRWLLLPNPREKFKGYPQLYWITLSGDGEDTTEIKIELPEGSEYVDLIAEYL